VRGILPNPPISGSGAEVARELVDGELVTVLVEDAAPTMALTIPRAAVLSDQSGDYVYVVDAENKAVQQRIKIGQSLPATAVVARARRGGAPVTLEGLRRVRPGLVVAPAPVAAPPGPAASPPAPRS